MYIRIVPENWHNHHIKYEEPSYIGEWFKITGSSALFRCYTGIVLKRSVRLSKVYQGWGRVGYLFLLLRGLQGLLVGL